MSRELEVSDRIDLGARLGPVMTACIGVATRGVQVPHTFSTECQTGATTPGADVRAWLPSRSRKLGEERPQLRRDDFRLAVVGGAQVVEPIQRLSPDAGQLAFERIEGCLEEQWALAATQQQDVCPD